MIRFEPGSSVIAVLHAAQWRFSLPWGQGLYSAQQLFSLPWGQGLHSAQWSFPFPWGQGLHSLHLSFRLPCEHRLYPLIILTSARAYVCPPRATTGEDGVVAFGFVGTKKKRRKNSRNPKTRKVQSHHPTFRGAPASHLDLSGCLRAPRELFCSRALRITAWLYVRQRLGGVSHSARHHPRDADGALSFFRRRRE